MRTFGSFNDLSPALKAKIVPIGKGEWVDYQMLPHLKVTTTDPTNGKKSSWYPHRQFWAKDTIWDEGKGGPVDIGVAAVGGVDPKTNIVSVFESFTFERSPAGLLRLSGDNILHREFHEFLQLSNMTENSLLGEHRDAGVQAEFKLMDYKKEAKAKTDKRKVKAEAMSYAQLMDAKEIREFAASMNWDPKQDLETLTDIVGEYAEQYPDEFTKKAIDPLMKTKAIIKMAIEAGKIVFDNSNYKMNWANGQTLASLERVNGKNELDSFADWIQTSTNGAKVLDQLRRKTPAQAENA